ncbi:MAG: hypothetical protein JWO64_1178 [Hyphomicrobiales bacterium]|jgi:hypothetical protein|nr:hypothetical protein [Hyphomicrobiales bacterium]
MAATAKKTDPKLWERVKAKVTRGAKGGRPGQWSARKAQLAVHDYKAAGGAYAGPKAADNRLSQWEREDWGTKSGRRSRDTGERYLPKKARASMTSAEYAQTTARKRKDTAKGKQVSRQPAKEARKTSAARRASSVRKTRAELYEAAERAQIPGRSRMKRDELERALHARR